MGQKSKKGKNRLDKYYHLAKEQGYRSRAAFKLIQLNRKYDFLSGARTLLDLCAAPGGWLQVAVKTMPVGALVLGVDLVPIKPVRGARSLLGDITTAATRAAVRRESSGALMDVVLHDGAPNVGGAWSSEAYSQSALVLDAARIAADLLAPGGWFITKVFRSKDYTALLYALRQLFNKVEATKPAASRGASAEIFVVCSGYRAPAKIDPRLLDARHLFQEVAEPPKPAGPDALLKAKVKQKRWREGYADGATILRTVEPAAGFVVSDAPVEALGRASALALEGGGAEAAAEGVADPAAAAAFVRAHPATTREIATLLADLHVLGRSEFKALLKWRLAVRKDFLKAGLADGAPAAAAAAAAAVAAAAAAEAAAGSGSDDDADGALGPEEKLLKEMAGIKERLERRRHRERRRRRELKTKSRLRAVQLAAAEGLADTADAEGLFSLGGLRAGAGAAAGVAEAAAPDSDAGASSDISTSGGEGSGGEGADSDEERRRYDAAMDEYLEESYRAWRTRQRMRDLGAAKKRQRLGKGGELEGGAEGAGDGGDVVTDESEDEEAGAAAGGGLAVALDARQAGVPGTAEAAAAQWFAQDLFDDPDVEADDEPPARRAPPRPSAAAAKAMAAAAAEDSGEEDSSDGGGAAPARARGLAAPAAAPGAGAAAAGFEEVPASDSDASSDSDGEFEALDDDAKAEVLALAKRWTRKRSREELLDAAYNRHAFHDVGLPKWFADDERKYMRPAPQITGAEFGEARGRLRGVDARPIKKVAEAKARKQKRLAGRLQKAKAKADAVAGQEDLPASARAREIEKLYRAARGSGKKKGKPSRRAEEKAQRKGPALDRRMFADKGRKGKGKSGGKTGVKGGGKGGKNSTGVRGGGTTKGGKRGGKR